MSFGSDIAGEAAKEEGCLLLAVALIGVVVGAAGYALFRALT
jgi:hypothetical protein